MNTATDPTKAVNATLLEVALLSDRRVAAGYGGNISQSYQEPVGKELGVA